MYRILPPPREPISVSLPQSKSITHRIAILAGLNHGKSRILNRLRSEDTQITVDALSNMGMAHSDDVEMRITTPIGTTINDKIFLGNSGSSARFLLPLAAFVDRPLQFSGVERLHHRPFSELFSALDTLGVRYQANEQSLPATIFPGKVKGGSITYRHLPSSQMVTALLLAALWMENNLQVNLPEHVPSLPYILMTVRLMKRLGLAIENRDSSIWVESKPPEFDWTYTVEKDLSAASYWVVLSLINNLPVTLQGITLPSLQGDERIFEIAESVGGSVMLFEDRVEIAGEVNKGSDIDCSDIPDLVPALSVLALFAPSSSVFRNIKHLEYKESNRIEALRHNIHVLGGKSVYENGNLSIEPGKKYQGAHINTYGDHRIAMSFAVAGTRIEGILIDEPDCVQKSYPDFWKDFTSWKESV
jgi:3-phosphoshikimate 1-carboxyvinyltransferase